MLLRAWSTLNFVSQIQHSNLSNTCRLMFKRGANLEGVLYSRKQTKTGMSGQCIFQANFIRALQLESKIVLAFNLRIRTCILFKFQSFVQVRGWIPPYLSPDKLQSRAWNWNISKQVDALRTDTIQINLYMKSHE